MINETLIMNSVEGQEELSLSIWAYQELDGRRRQAKGIRVAEDDLVVDVKEKEKGGGTKMNIMGKLFLKFIRC